MSDKAAALESIWRGLLGTWRLSRTLQSANSSEPSGTCSGTVTFTMQEPAVFVDIDGQLQKASKQLLYTETGEFEMSSNLGLSTPAPKFTFSRKYIWRLQHYDLSNPEISVWFPKPGTEKVDYLFHKFLIQSVDQTADRLHIDCSGGHLCVDDYYSSSYTFCLGHAIGNTVDATLQSWTMLHEVRGPKKDQIIETQFSQI